MLCCAVVMGNQCVNADKPHYHLACLVLAAGQSKRFGAVKALLKSQGSTLLERTLKEIAQAVACNGLPPASLFVALGAHQEAIFDKLNTAALPTAVSFIPIKDWSLGMGRSLSESVTFIAAQRSPQAFTHLLVSLVDQVALQAIDYSKLIAVSLEKHSPSLVAAQFTTGVHEKSHEVVGAPAIFSAQYFTALQQLQGDTGAKHIIQQAGEALCTMPMPKASIDIDTPKDWDLWRKTNLETP